MPGSTILEVVEAITNLTKPRAISTVRRKVEKNNYEALFLGLNALVGFLHC